MDSFIVSAVIAAVIIGLRESIAKSDMLAWVVTIGVIIYSIAVITSI